MRRAPRLHTMFNPYISLHPLHPCRMSSLCVVLHIQAGLRGAAIDRDYAQHAFDLTCPAGFAFLGCTTYREHHHVCSVNINLLASGWPCLN